MWTYHFPVLNFHIHSWFFYEQLRHLHRLRCQSIGYWLHQLLNLMWISGTQCLALFTETLETAVNPNLRITQTIVDLNTLKKMCYGFVAWVIMLDFQLISRSPVTSYQIYFILLVRKFLPNYRYFVIKYNTSWLFLKLSQSFNYTILYFYLKSYVLSLRKFFQTPHFIVVFHLVYLIALFFAYLCIL